jgi:hypothetical protein
MGLNTIPVVTTSGFAPEGPARAHVDEPTLCLGLGHTQPEPFGTLRRSMFGNLPIDPSKA